MATGHWLTNRGKTNLLLGRGSTFKVGLLVGTQPAAADTQIEVADLDTVNALLVTAGATECSVGGYARVTWSGFTKTQSNANDRVDIIANSVSFGALSTGQTIIGAFVYDPTVDTSDSTRDLISVDWYPAGVPTNGGTYAWNPSAAMYQLA